LVNPALTAKKFSLLTEHVLDDDFVLFAQQSERVPARLAGRYRMRLDPAAAGEPIEVVARLHRVVHRVQNGARHRHASLARAQSCHEQTPETRLYND